MKKLSLILVIAILGLAAVSGVLGYLYFKTGQELLKTQQELDGVKQELNQVKQNRDQLLSELDGVKQDRDQLLIELNEVKQQRDLLLAEEEKQESFEEEAEGLDIEKLIIDYFDLLKKGDYVIAYALYPKSDEPADMFISYGAFVGAVKKYKDENFQISIEEFNIDSEKEKISVRVILTSVSSGEQNLIDFTLKRIKGRWVFIRWSTF